MTVEKKVPVDAARGTTGLASLPRFKRAKMLLEPRQVAAEKSGDESPHSKDPAAARSKAALIVINRN